MVHDTRMWHMSHTCIYDIMSSYVISLPLVIVVVEHIPILLLTNCICVLKYSSCYYLYLCLNLLTVVLLYVYFNELNVLLFLLAFFYFLFVVFKCRLLTLNVALYFNVLTFSAVTVASSLACIILHLAHGLQLKISCVTKTGTFTELFINVHCAFLIK